MFGLVVPSRPVLANSSIQVLSPTQFAYTVAALPYFSHIVVFLLPDQYIPPDAAAAVYIGSPPADFRLVGAIDASQPSAIFKLPGSLRGTGIDGSGDLRSDGVVGMQTRQNDGVEVDMDSESPPAVSEITIGISIEPASKVAHQVIALSGDTATKSGDDSEVRTERMKLLAQRIIRNAFNFLASFADGRGNEMVPLKSFEAWWRKFESRIQSDPRFLERD